MYSYNHLWYDGGNSNSFYAICYKQASSDEEPCEMAHSKLTCDSDGSLNVHVSFEDISDKNVDRSLLIVGGHWDEEDCKGTIDSRTQAINFDFTADKCDVRITSNDTHIVYSASVREGHNTDQVYRRAFFEIQLECSFARMVDVVVHDSFKPLLARDICTLEDFSGEFEVEMSLFTDSAMSTALGEGHEITVPDPLYAKLEVLDALDQFILKIENCWATPTQDADDVVSYKIIENFEANADEADYLELTQNCENDVGTFWLETFVFPGHEQVFLHCRVNICDSAVEDCSCAETSRRRRRSTTPEANLVTIGPIGVAK